MIVNSYDFEQGDDVYIYTCNTLWAFDALNLMEKVMSLFPGDEFVVMTSQQGRDCLRNDVSDIEFICNKEAMSDAVFITKLLKKVNLKCDGEVVDIDNHFDDTFHLYEILSWIVECSYTEALNREQIDIPDILHNADKLVNAKYPKQDDGRQIGEEISTQGVPPPNMSPWLFSIIASVDKNKRCDWELLHKFKTSYTLVDFMDIYECVESAKSYESAALINSL